MQLSVLMVKGWFSSCSQTGLLVCTTLWDVDLLLLFALHCRILWSGRFHGNAEGMAEGLSLTGKNGWKRIGAVKPEEGGNRMFREMMRKNKSAGRVHGNSENRILWSFSMPGK